MSRSNQVKLKKAKGADGRAVVPEGLPSWITPDLIRETIRVWKKYYVDSLTPEDAATIVENVGRLFGVLSRE